MGYKVQVTKLETCPGSIVKLEPDATATLTNDCKLILKGCGETSGFSTAKVAETISCWWIIGILKNLIDFHAPFRSTIRWKKTAIVL